MHLNFPNLDSCYTGVNMGLSNGSIPSVVACGVHCVPEFLHISVDKAIMNTIVDRMGYTDRRMPLLERTYLDQKRWEEFMVSAVSCKLDDEKIYHFKKKPPVMGVPRENCLVFVSYHGWTGGFTVVWRTTEFSARWGADLKLISNLLRGERVNLVIPHGYQHPHCWPGVAELMNLTPEPLDPTYRKVYTQARGRYYPGGLSMDSLSGWGPIRSIQKMVIKNRREKDELL